MASSSSSSPEFSAAEPVVDAQSRFSYKDATQDEVLEDLSSRFILNLPDEELNSLERVCFQVEQAHWFYEDFIREENHKLSSMPLKKFSEMLFHACPLLHQWSHDHEEAFKNFMQYKTRVPVCGAIMLNDAMDKCVLVKGWKASSNWGFPKGKINETEPPFACAIREVLEETGYNIAGQIDPSNVIELSIKEQKISLFFVPGVPEDFNFQTRTRKEISQIAWFKLSDLPTWRRNKSQPPNKKFYLISPFIGPLKAFINETKNRNGKKAGRPRKGNGTYDEVPSTVAQSKGAFPSSTGATPEVTNNGQSKKEGEWGPELTRLFSGLAAISKQGVDGHASNESQGNGNTGDLTSASDEPSDSSLDSPVAARTQPSTNDPRTAETTVQSTPAQSRPPTSNAPSIVQVDRQTPIKSGTPSLPSVSPASSRRPSATADISPYLSRRTEIPVSAKTLQHLQLLETVADESARMAPVLAARAAYPPLPGPPHQLPHDMGPYPPMHPGLSSSAAGFHPRPPGTSLPYNTYPDPLQLRSHTSQAFHRPTMHNSGSMSMNQNNLLAAINGARGGPMPQNYPVNLPFLPQQPHPSGAYLPPRQPNTYPMSAPAAQGFGPLPGILSSGPPPTINSQPSLHTLLRQLPGPDQLLTHTYLPTHTYAPPNPTFPPGMAPAPPAGHNPLLSILNGRSMQAPAPSNISQL